MLSEVRGPPWYRKSSFPLSVAPGHHLRGLRKLTVDPRKIISSPGSEGWLSAPLVLRWPDGAGDR